VVSYPPSSLGQIDKFHRIDRLSLSSQDSLSVVGTPNIYTICPYGQEPRAKNRVGVKRLTNANSLAHGKDLADMQRKISVVEGSRGQNPKTRIIPWI
jgi:hypothetical protein